MIRGPATEGEMMRVLRSALFTLLFTAAAQAAPGVLQANSVNVREDDGSVTVVVERRNGSEGEVKVDYETRSGSAVAGRDFTPVSGKLTFADGVTSRSVTIPILDNATYDGNRTFFLDLSHPTGGATLGTSPSGDVDLFDDEPPPDVSIGDVRVIEGDSGSANADFTISISGAPRSIDVRIFWDTNDFSATAGSDFASSGGSFFFTPADTQKTVSVPVHGDTTVEEDERFVVFIYGGANFVRQQGYCTIADDDAGPFTITALDGAVVEGNDGTTSAILTLIADQTLRNVSIDYAAAGGTAVAGSDYHSGSGTVTFRGESTKQIVIPIIGDTDLEPDEHFTVHLSTRDPRVTLVRTDLLVVIVNDDVR
jgi:Calx-beta domain